MRFIFLLLLVTSFAFGQDLPPVDKITDKQIIALMKEAESRGLTENEAEAVLKARGYSDADIAIIRERANRIKVGAVDTNNKELSEVSREQLGELSKRVEDEIKVDVDKKHEIFGKKLFEKESSQFEPNLRIATPDNYVLGPDDELELGISGYASAHYKLKVSPEGWVRIEHFNPMMLSGLSIEQARDKLKSSLSSSFAGLRNGTLKLDLTLSKIKSIKVIVSGEVEKQGTYTVSALSSVFNVLYEAKGPNEIGSFRNIQVLRNGRIIQIVDVYDFLTTGSLKSNISLRDQDIIFVPIAGNKVTVKGEVYRPMIFELLPSESIVDVVKYGGGFTPNAFSSEIKVIRNNAFEREIFDIKKENFANFLLKNGDFMEIGAILNRFANRVEVVGAVFRPGQYALDSLDLTVSDLVNKAGGLREDAYKEGVILKRLNKQLDPEFIQLDLGELSNLKLQREDVLIIKSITELREFRTVSISGKVNQTGNYDFQENMTVEDLILLAGGFSEGATPKRIEVARRLFNDEREDRTVEIIDYEIGSSRKLTLMPFDKVFVRELPNYKDQEIVKVDGEVNYPGQYVIENRQERISNLIERVGGIRTTSAYLKGAKFFRDGKQVALDFEKILTEPKSVANLFLKDGDRLYIPKQEQTVAISGQVQTQTLVAFQPKYSVKDYIIQAGGFTDSAYVKQTYVIYANGHTDKVRSFLGMRFFPKAEAGMNIHVPVKRRERMTKAEVIAVSSGMISLSAVLLTLFRLL